MPRPHQDSRSLRGTRTEEYKASGSTVVPYGASYVTIVTQAGGGGGGGGQLSVGPGGSGGSGSMSIASFQIRSDDWGKIISFTIGTGGTGGASNAAGGTGTATSIVSLTLNGTATGTLTTNGGAGGLGNGGGGTGGAGGAAGTGGTVDTGKVTLGSAQNGRRAGYTGTTLNPPGANSPSYNEGGGLNVTIGGGDPGFLPGAGGAAGSAVAATGGAGSSGEIRFFWSF